MKNLDVGEELALYEPSPEVLQKLGEVVLYAIVAPYSSGKNSIIDWLVSHRPHQFAHVVGDTTRVPRKGEVDGLTYHFRSKAEMIDDLHNSRFVQVVPGFMGNFYATRPEQYPIGKIAIKPIQAREVPKFKKLGFKDVKWLQIVPHSEGAWQQWQSTRRYSPKEQRQREEEAIQSYMMSSADPDTYYVLNDEIEKAARRLLQVARGERPDDEARARSIAADNLAQLAKTLKDNQ